MTVINMDVLTSSLVSLGLLFAAGLWMARHIQLWRQTRERETDARELDFRRRQFSRRMQTSGLLASLAIAIFTGIWIPGPPLLLTFYWIGVLLLLVWLMVLAAADGLATHVHFSRVRDHYAIEQRRLKAELKRLRGEENGSE